MAAKPAPKPQPETPAAPAPKKSKLLLIITLTCVLLGGGGAAGAWYFLKPSSAPEEKTVKPPVFLPLESFTVNLLPNEGQAQYIQTGLTLKLEDDAAAELVKQRLPEVRNRILMVISSRKGTDLIPTQGKQKLAEELASGIRAIVEPTKPVRAKAKEEEEEDKLAEDADEAEIKAEKARAAKRAAAKVMKIEVLFTSMIIQ